MAFVDLYPFDVAKLDEDPATICAIDERLHVVFVNRAWHRFARSNGARWRPGDWSVGCSLMDAIPTLLRPFHEKLLERALRGELVEHDYDCSSPDHERRFRMRIFPRPLERVTKMAKVLLVVHAVLRDVPRDPAGIPLMPAIEADYRGEGGIMSQCSHCRRVLRVKAPIEWEWVAAFVESAAERVSHGLCPVCAAYYYPLDDA